MNDLPENLKEFAVRDVSAEKIARVYAEALLNQALKQGQQQEVLDELRSLVHDVFRTHPEVEEFLVRGAGGRELKKQVIQNTFGEHASPLLLNFLLVLNEHDRLELIRPCVFLYMQQLDQRQGRVRAQVRSAVPLTPEQQERLTGELRQTLKMEPLLETTLDPELLGGLVVRVGDWLYDASVRTRMENLRNQILESSSHEIQAGRDRFRTGTAD